MKKILLFASALAGLFLAGSCQRENLEPMESANTVTYTVQVADAVGTKVIGNDVTAVNELVYEVYRTVDEGETDFTNDDKLLYHKTADINEGVATIELEFVNDQNFTVLFWAQTRNNGVYDVDDLTDVKILDQDVTNLENTAVFVGRDFVRDCVSEKNGKVTLVRPVSQINIGTTAESLVFEAEAGEKGSTITLEGSTVKVKGLATTYNIATLSATGNATTEYAATYTERPVPLVDLELTAGTYEYVAMNYVGFASNEGSTITVSYIINTTEGNIENEIENVPVKPNYRTNIIGNLITSKADYTITLDKQWYDANGGNMEVIEEGLIKNVNGDYEISEAKGLAYAMNNLFVEGGDFYLTAPSYDLTGFNVTAPTIPNGVTLNIYGETPVVTRAATTFAGITIIGLPEVNGTPALIEAVENGGTVAVSGVTLQDEGSVIVSNNQGTLVVTESEVGADSYVADGKAPVEAESVKSFADLKTALASEVVTAIDLAADIEATEALEINRSITINGNGKKLTSSASRVVNFTAPEIVVEFNDWAFVSTAARNGQNGPRGLNIWGPEVHDAELTFNRCSVDFTHETANDWTYAVNCGVNQNNTITINGGTYEGANVVNVWGKNHTITIDGAVLTSLYQPSSAYYGFCVSLQEAENSKATIKNSTLNSVHAKAFGGTTKNEFVLENNTDNTQVYPFFIGNAPYLTLNEAFAAAENNATIYAPFNAEISSSTVPEGKKVTLVLQNQATKYNTQLTGVDNLTGSFGLINVNSGANLTITGPGSIKLSATENRGWNAYSSVVSNQRGTLTVNGGAVIEHLGGTDMAYGIDNLTNGKGTKATTIVDGATVKSTYRAIRQFLNGTEATNDLTVKAGSVVEGANKSIWMQDPSANLNTGKLVVEEGAVLNGDVYLFVTAGSEAWPVEVSIADSALAGESTVMTGNVPAGYSVENVGGVWKVIAWTSVSTADELVAALEAKQSVVFANDIKIDPANMSNAYGATGINIKYGQSIDGNGKTLNIQGAGGTWDSGINTTGGLIKNLTVTGSFRGIFINHTSTYSEKVVLENVTIGGNGTVYTISCDQGLYQGIEATNCTFNGWTSFAKTAGEAKFVNCNFGEGSGYKYCRPYSNTEFVGCTFCPGYAVDTTRATVTFTDCTWEE